MHWDYVRFYNCFDKEKDKNTFAALHCKKKGAVKNEKSVLESATSYEPLLTF